MPKPLMSTDEYRQLLREVEEEIARDRAAILPKIAEHQGLQPEFLDRTFLQVRGLFTFPAVMPDTPENRRTLESRELTFGYDVIGGLSVALLAFQDLPWITPQDLHALAEGDTVNWHARVPWDRLTRCLCMTPEAP
ncbi:hypothetical protein [Streptomyces chartreusis]|uniref:hypothetical protein n=1 Tax=Streptomyces chartreusis TaxID=1969 RepID=UPI003638DDD8